MARFPALDVAVGLNFVYLVLSVLATTATETIYEATRRHARRVAL